MKRFVSVVLMFMFLFSLTACAVAPAVSQGLIGLPDEGRLLVLSLLTYGVGWLLSKIKMGQFTEAIAAALAPVIITAIEAGLQLIPPVFDNLVLSLIHLIVLFAGGLVTSLVLKRVKNPRTMLHG